MEEDPSSERSNLDGEVIKQMVICIVGGGGFIGSHLCEKLMTETKHFVMVIDHSSDKINHLLGRSCSWYGRIRFSNMDPVVLQTCIKAATVVINLGPNCYPQDYNLRPLDSISTNFLDAIPVVRYCVKQKKRLIHFSSCEVYGKTIGSFLPEDDPVREDPKFYVLKEDASPCILGTIKKQRWSYACAKQLMERFIYAVSAENCLECTIVRPFNWIGPRMDFIRGIDGEGIPRVLACFATNLMLGEPLKLVDGGQSRRSFCYIDDALDAVLLMIENPKRANGKIFNVGNPDNEVTIKKLAEMMIEVYAEVSGDPSVTDLTTEDVSSEDFYGLGYDDSDRRVPDMTIIKSELNWLPTTSLDQILRDTLTYQHATYAAED